MSVLKQEAATVGLARLLVVRPDGSALVLREGEAEPFVCDRLTTSDRQRLTLYPNDVVAVMIPVVSDERGVILGRIAPSRGPRDELAISSRHTEEPASDELVIEARKSLTLRVGEGSITIREDGKILIKGKDLVSHAQRLNRIKGGAVQIN